MEKRKTGLALELLTTVVAHSDISNTAMCTLATNLWGLVQRTGQADTKAMVCVMLECLLFVWRGSVCACVWGGLGGGIILQLQVHLHYILAYKTNSCLSKTVWRMGRREGEFT